MCVAYHGHRCACVWCRWLQVFIIIDFIWSLIESYTIASSKELKWLSLRTACDIGCYGATLPIIIIAMSAAGVVSAVTNDVAKCAATPALRDDFERISSKAATVAGTFTYTQPHRRTHGRCSVMWQALTCDVGWQARTWHC